MREEKSMAEVKPGDVVRLTSGGPPMTVGNPATRGVFECRWFDGVDLRSGPFPPDSLAPAVPASPGGAP